MPIRTTLGSKDSSTLFIQVWGDNWLAIATYIQKLPNSRWIEEKQLWRTPIDNMATLRDWMAANLPDDKRFCDSATTEIIKSYFARLDRLKALKNSADLDLTAIYPRLHLNQFTKTNYQPGEYQKIGAAWLAAIGSGVLADAYGVGKTVQGIMAALILDHRKLIDGVLVFGTKEASKVWEREIKKFTFEKPVRAEGKNRWAQYGSQFFSITTYTKISEPAQKEKETEEDFKARVVASDFSALKELLSSGNYLIIFDEFHKCARRSAKRTQSCKKLAKLAVARFGISADGGFQNGGEDIFNTYSIIDENILGKWETFRKNCLLAKWGGGYTMTEKGKQWVAQRTADYMLRRTRDQIGIERKDIQTQTVYVDLSEEERTWYENADAGIFSTDVEGNEQACRLVDITRMRQVCLSPSLVDPSAPRISSKLDKIEDIVEELIEEGHKIIIYCFFDSWFPMVEERLKQFGVLQLTGKTRNTGKVQEMFNNDPQYKIILITDAAAESISLPAASVTIKATIPWNPSKNGQVDGRMDRMTQEKNMLSIDIIMKDTYEEDMKEIQDTKAADFEAMVITAGEMGIVQMLKKYRTAKKEAKAAEALANGVNLA